MWGVLWQLHPIYIRDSRIAIHRTFLEQTPEDTKGLLHILKQNSEQLKNQKFYLH